MPIIQPTTRRHPTIAAARASAAQWRRHSETERRLGNPVGSYIADDYAYWAEREAATGIPVPHRCDGWRTPK